MADDQRASDLGELRDRVGHLEKGLEENTAATKRIETNTSEIIDMFDSFKGAMRVLEGIGKLAKPLGYIFGVGAAIASIWAAIKTGIGPK